MNTTPEDGHGQDLGPRRRLPLLAGVLAVAGILVIAFAFVRQQPDPPALTHADHVPSRPPSPQPSPSESKPKSPRQDATQRPRTQQLEGIRGPVMRDSPPTRLIIPKLGVDSTLEDLTLDRSGVLTVPRDPAKAGWFRRGPAPGSPGPAVIAGHVTWDREPAVFFDLARLRQGDRISVTRRDGSTATFTVTGLEQYDKDRFPTQQVYGSIDHAGLRLITCGGTYDGKRHRYKANLIAFAVLTGAEP
ncbi:class F sortase [Flindersiella endophytica]